MRSLRRTCDGQGSFTQLGCFRLSRRGHALLCLPPTSPRHDVLGVLCCGCLCRGLSGGCMLMAGLSSSLVAAGTPHSPP